MHDIERFFLWFVGFFGVLSVVGVVLGYAQLLYMPCCLFAIFVSSMFSWYLVRDMKSARIRYPWHLISVVFAMVAVFLCVSVPYIIFPHSYVDYGLNTSQARLVVENHGFSGFSHVYPNVYYGVLAMFAVLFGSIYSVSTAFSFLLMALTVVVVFLLGRVVFGEKVGLVSAFLYAFSPVNVMLLEQGYLTQIFATFFFAASMYLTYMADQDRKYLPFFVLSAAGLVSYIHYLAIFVAVVFIYYRRLAGWSFFGMALMIPELSGFVMHIVNYYGVMVGYLTVGGGILVPNLFVLSVLAFSALGYVWLFRDDRYRCAVGFLNGVLLFIAVFAGFFVLKFLSGASHTTQLYTVVKLVYLLFLPAMFFAGYAMMRAAAKRWWVAVAFLAMYVLFFVSYVSVLPDKNNLPDEVCFSSEMLSGLGGGSVIGIDPCMLQDGWVQPGLYDTLYGRPDNYTEFSYIELNFVLLDEWVLNEADYTYRGGRPANITHDIGQSDYYVAYCEYPSYGDEIYRQGSLRVYDMSG